MQLFSNIFSTKVLMFIACVLVGVLIMKSLGAYYGFNWATALAAQ
jgi:hypothetical protein